MGLMIHERAVYLNGQFGAWSPRQPQWQHWGALWVTKVVHSSTAAPLRISVGMGAARGGWHDEEVACDDEAQWRVACAACMAVVVRSGGWLWV